MVTAEGGYAGYVINECAVVNEIPHYYDLVGTGVIRMQYVVVTSCVHRRSAATNKPASLQALNLNRVTDIQAPGVFLAQR